jgi:hypothetical protein
VRSPSLHLHELDVLELDVQHLGRGDDRGIHGRAGQDGGGEAHPLVGIELDLIELVVDHALLFGGQRLFGHKELDEVAIALIRRNAAGGSVRWGDEAFVLEGGHLVADGGGGDGDGDATGDRLGGDGDGGIDVVLDDELEDVAAAVGEHGVLVVLLLAQASLALSHRDC